ncbi:MAG: hypothetical protein NUK65_07615 [Firmicutes bacterium]|nr:hypothetical protein [Bacillota bacterium]
METIEAILKPYPFAKEFLLVFFSVLLGGIFTAAINNGAMRKKCLFDMQYEILKAEAKKVSELHKALEGLEIGLSFVSRKTDDFESEIQSIKSMALKTNERLRDQRKFVRKYLSATLVEESALIVSDYLKIMYQHGNGGIMNLEVIKEADAETLNRLRVLTSDVQKLNDGLSESLEQLISPSLFAKIKRKIRKPLMIVEDTLAIVKVHRKQNMKK